MRKGIRSSVKWFASEMIKTLTLPRNMAKAHWSMATKDFLFDSLRAEVKELKWAMENGSTDLIVHEATDIANFAMMIADNARYEGNEDGEEVRRYK